MRNKHVGLLAIASAALASVCCIGPIMLAGLGLGSLGFAAGLTRYRPLFLILTAIVLAIGFYRAYRKRSVACADGTCEYRSGSRTMKTALWAITIAATAIATFPNWSAWIMARGPAPVLAGAHTLSLKVSGMDCAACTVAIKKSVERVPGVISADIDFDSRLARVVTDFQADPKAVIKAVAKAGYKAELLDGGNNGKPRS